MKFILSGLLLLLSLSIIAQNTETIYLSGKGADQTVDWDFYCSAGMNSGKWTKIPVPSCWELQGFGAYNYGHDKFESRLNETGLYRYNFQVPANWKNKEVTIVFEGVMTDAEVKVNGKSAGAAHQGAFYRFTYNISKLLKAGRENKLEVLVKKHSENHSINLAERKADFWIFGGIFRPVFLEAKPKTNIQRVAIDAKANGTFTADVYLNNTKNTAKTIAVEIATLEGKKVNKFQQEINGNVSRVSHQFNNIKTWSPEYPNLYQATFHLKNKAGEIIHSFTERTGFRTIEVRDSEGIFVNGMKIKMQGVCRHTFHPKHGRTSSKKLSIEAVNLMKEMNMNAVRMSHYSPDKHFLDVCDSLGMFVLDELTAWQKPSYDNVVGRKLLEELIADDVNHPSIIMWDNGNEGGENNTLNDDFAELDIQKREVLHPWGDFRKTNTAHYIKYYDLSNDEFSRRKIFFPTEFLHGMFDGGHGAGLEDYWLRMWNDPLCAGGFLWVFADEAVERTDKNRELDTDGNHAPDGILGPYNEKEGSFYTIKHLWSPVFIENKYIGKDFSGDLTIQNRFYFSNLNRVTINLRWVNYSTPDQKIGKKTLFTETLKADLEPKQFGKLKLNLFDGWKNSDALEITATDETGRVLNNWTYPIKLAAEKAQELAQSNNIGSIQVEKSENEIKVHTQAVTYTFSAENGQLVKAAKKDALIPLKNGPVFVSTNKELLEVKLQEDENSISIRTSFKEKVSPDFFEWTIEPNGLLHLKTSYIPKHPTPFAGISFSLNEEKISGMRWMGKGPFRVWKNRMKGPEFGVWEKAYNNTITGYSGYEYPEFKGYHAETYWIKVLGKNAPNFKVYVHSNDIFMRMLTPEFSKNSRGAQVEFPKGDFSFLHGINGIGTKFMNAKDSGPMASEYHYYPKKMHGRKLHIELTFDFR